MPTDTEITAFIRALDDTKRQLAVAKNQHKRMGLNWAQVQDSRSAWFDGTWKMLTLTPAHLQLSRGFLQHLGFWQRISPNMTADIHEALKSEADALYRWSIIHTTYSQLEEALRLIATAYDPNFMSKPQSIAAVEGKLLSELGLEHYADLFLLTRLIRNTIHTNGYYRPDRGGDRDVPWDGTTYAFRVDSQISWLSWPFIAAHVKALCDAMSQIVTHQQIVSLPTIKR